MPNTREKLIELLGGDMCKGCYCEDCEHENNEKACIEHIKARMADHLIANGVTIQRWIPVTERLPEPGVDVLCWYEYFRYGDYNRMYQTYGIGHCFPDGFWGGEVSNCQKTKVFAWMPLPEPPKGE